MFGIRHYRGYKRRYRLIGENAAAASSEDCHTSRR
jgi:hypothetical protein